MTTNTNTNATTNFLKTASEITAWLDALDLSNYTLIQNEQYGFVVNVNQNVDLCSKKIRTIPVKFNYILGEFDCSENYLTNLEFCPQIVGRFFFCPENPLLGESQTIIDFQEIKKIQQKIIDIKQEKSALNLLIQTPKPSRTSHHKI